ncbi:MAG: bifunctional diaminohydroxyphosphoribosylaminopyrimidine deaminase/5-amino-6-(5-phosphoribosylamino)uracil reductase RibD [Bacteroidetes bacterium]|nr:bifunctional diaminohydroxyphosphoribosylaminopyrimidine deaminase/5-amino-6-(5-phosphoribosylamino)uracil reductase RibD [Bacteroidota bacterium]
MSETIPHESYMQRCLHLAQLGAGQVAPNPMVGSVLVHKNRIIGEGYHQQFGAAHAEVLCIQSVCEQDKNLIADSTLYVNLEPCSHFGKTPPCVDYIKQHQIPKVVIGCKDFSSKVNGMGIARLREDGVEVLKGILEKESKLLNRRFFYFEGQQVPYVILKWAESADGFIGKPKQRLKISNPFSDRLVHQWRAEESAILVGYQTAFQDNPQLNVRLAKGKNPIRIVLDRELELPSHLHFFDQSQETIVFNTLHNKSDAQIEYIKIGPENELEQMLEILGKKKVSSLLVEGGAKCLQQWVDANQWNEARVIKSAVYLHEGIAAPHLQNAETTTQMQVQNDTITFFTNYTRS